MLYIKKERRLVVDIESNDILQNLINYKSLPYKLREDARLWCVVFRDVDTDEVFHQSLSGVTKEWMESVLSEAKEVIAHNGIKFDFIALKLFGLLDYTIGYLNESDTVFGKPVKFTDTLIWSRLFNPDRRGGHSLKAWGSRLGDFKDEFSDFKKYSEKMLKYCIQDTKVTALLFKELEKEWLSYPKWAMAEKLENKLADLAVRRETYGFWFDKDLAIRCLDDLTKKMDELRNNVNPLLPPKPLNKTKRKLYTPPVRQFTKIGDYSAALISFAKKHNATLEERFFIYKGKKFELPLTEIIENYEEPDIGDLDHVKMHLITLGWRPTEWKIRDLTKDSKKQSIPYEKRIKALENWLDQTFNENKYKELRLKELGMSNRDLIYKKLSANLKQDKPVRVPTSPMVRVGIEKELCPNLIKLGDKVSFAKDFTLYLTYKHRKSSIAGGEIEDMDFEEEYPNKGFLSMYREEDCRVATPAIEIGASTNRYRHIGVCNVARASSLYGKEMRSLFGVDKSMRQLGFDFSSLEARIQGHYILPFDGEELAEQLLASKPNDIHCYSEDTEILTEGGWKTFGNLLPKDKVAQYENGVVFFVKPSEVVWQKYSGKMYVDPATKFKVTPNHRVLYKSFSTGKENIVRADEFNPSSDKRFVVGGVKSGSNLDLDDSLIKLLVATQADGFLSKDCSAIQFTFVKEKKIRRLLSILTELGADYTLRTHNRKGRDETCIRVKASPLSLKVRKYLNKDKSFSALLLGLGYSKLDMLLQEVGEWDGTLKSNGDIVFDTTDKTSCEFVQTVAAMTGRKANFSMYNRQTTYGDCLVYRSYISMKTEAVKSANKDFEVVDYDGYVGCVSVPSGLVLVKRNNSIVVSGNTINAKKLGIIRDFAKSISYMLMYGGSAARARAMLGITMKEAEALVEAYWNAVPALKALKDAVGKVWKKRGRKFVVGIDGRKIVTRSEHSLLNALFQSGGVICAKYTTVFLYEYLEKKGWKCNPFEDEIDFCGMIEYHDECQTAVKRGLVEVKFFATEGEAKKFCAEWKGEQLGSIVATEKGKFAVALPNEVSRGISHAIERAGEVVGLRVPLGMEWVVGNNWYTCH